MFGTIWRHYNDDLISGDSDWSEISELLTGRNCELLKSYELL